MTKSAWFVRKASKTYGPFSSEQLRKLAKDKKIDQETPVRLGDEGKWVVALKVKGLFEATSDEPKEPLAETSVPCPHCKKYVSPSADVCRHCHADLTP